MRTGIVLLTIAVPLIELALLIRAGQSIGFWPLMAIILLTGTLGVIVFRRQGLKMLRRLFEMQQGSGHISKEHATAPLIDSGLVYFAATLLVFPGLLGDVTGLVLLIPPIRSWIAQRFARSPLMGSWVWIESRGPGPQRPGPQRHGPHDRTDPPRSGRSDTGTTIDGEFERLDERPIDRRRKPPTSP